MSDLAPRPSRTPRRKREQRAYRLTLAAGGSAIATVVFGVLAIFGVGGWGFVLLFAILTVAAGFALRRTIS